MNMEATEKVKTLQAIYAGALADSVLRLGREGVLEKVTQQKRAEQLAGGKARAAQLGITSAEEVFTKLSDLMGCADWRVSANEDGKGFTAAASRCILCAFAKKMGTQSPCHIYCLDPMEGMVKALGANADYRAESTLFEGGECRVVVSPAGK
jgi:hypothetical protein